MSVIVWASRNDEYVFAVAGKPNPSAIAFTLNQWICREPVRNRLDCLLLKQLGLLLALNDAASLLAFHNLSCYWHSPYSLSSPA